MILVFPTPVSPRSTSLTGFSCIFYLNYSSRSVSPTKLGFSATDLGPAICAACEHRARRSLVTAATHWSRSSGSDPAPPAAPACSDWCSRLLESKDSRYSTLLPDACSARLLLYSAASNLASHCPLRTHIAKESLLHKLWNIARCPLLQGAWGPSGSQNRRTPRQPWFLRQARDLALSAVIFSGNNRLCFLVLGFRFLWIWWFSLSRPVFQGTRLMVFCFCGYISNSQYLAVWAVFNFWASWPFLLLFPKCSSRWHRRAPLRPCHGAVFLNSAPYFSALALNPHSLYAAPALGSPCAPEAAIY